LNIDGVALIDILEFFSCIINFKNEYKKQL